MILATDLKPYNHVAVKGDAGVYSVHGIRLAFFHPMTEDEALIDRPHSFHQSIKLSRLKGIPLTEFTVKKLGFLFGGSHYYHPENPDWYIWNFTIKDKSVWKTITHHRNVGNKPNETYKKLQFVHELQNAFYECSRVMIRFDNYNMKEK